MKLLVNYKTPTVNHLYGKTKFGIYLKPEARALRKKIIQDIHEHIKTIGYFQDQWKNRLLKIKVTIFEDWFTKKGEVKKKDISNREKFLIDTIMEALGLEDKFIWEHVMIKKNSQSEYAEVEIEHYSEPSIIL